MTPCATPRDGVPVEVAEGVLLLRLPLPLALDHVNAFLLDEGDGWTVIDTGVDTATTRAAWRAALASPVLRGRPVRRLLVTHHHPDHIGLAGWLARRWGVPVEMTAAECAVARRYKDARQEDHDARVRFWGENGLSPARAESVVNAMPDFDRLVHALPGTIETINPERPLRAGGRTWEVLVGEGHSPAQITLFSREEDLLLVTDQVLPTITPNIGVWPGGDRNPLHAYLRTIAPLAELGRDPLVLPAHQAPFRGLAGRVREIQDHHARRLEHLLAYCATPRSCFEALPALFDRSLPDTQLGFAMGESLAHLHYLHERGDLALDTDGGVRRFRALA